MIGSWVKATDGSVAIAGDNNGSAFNINVASGGRVIIEDGVKASQALGTYLGRIIAVVAQQSLSEYGHKYQRDISVEVVDKLQFNYIQENDQLVKSYRRYFYTLDRAYQGAEQSNNDARVLVRLRAGSIYGTELTKACTIAGISSAGRVDYSRNHSHALIDAVKNQLVIDFISNEIQYVDPTWVDLAMCLLVIDAVTECEVLEKRTYVTST